MSYAIVGALSIVFAINSTLLLTSTNKLNTLTKKIFVIYVISITSWVYVVLINMFVYSYFVAELVFASATLGLTAQLWFSKVFTTKTLPKKIYSYWSIMVGLFFFIVSFVPGILFSTIVFTQSGYVILTNGLLSIPYSIFVLFCTITPIVIFYKKRKQVTSAALQAQLTYLIIGFSLFLFVSILTNSILPTFFNIYFLNTVGPISSLFLAIFIFYIIWRYEFLDIRIAIQRGVVYTILFSLITGTYLVVLLFISEFIHKTTIITVPISAFIVMMVGIFTIPVLDKYLKAKTDFIFFKDTYNYEETIKELSNIMNTHIIFDSLVSESLCFLKTALRIDRIDFIRYKDLLKHDYSDKLHIIISSRRRGLGVLVLGNKLSGSRFTKKDYSLIDTFASEFSTALEKAFLFEKLRQYSHKLERKVSIRTQHIKKLQEDQKLIVGDMSHALQTPLTVLKSSLYLITNENTKKHKHIRIMQKSVDSISIFVHDLLRLSLINTTLNTHKTRFDLSKLIHDTTDYVETICNENDITLSQNIENNLKFFGDKQDIRELITILLSNAVSYTRIHYIENKKISINLQNTNNSITIEIKDNGIGIPKNKIRFVFERLYQAHTEHANQGSGLGLAIARRIAEKHNGTITVKSIETKGSVFTISFKKTTPKQD